MNNLQSVLKYQKNTLDFVAKEINKVGKKNYWFYLKSRGEYDGIDITFYAYNLDDALFQLQNKYKMSEFDENTLRNNLSVLTADGKVLAVSSK